MQSVYCISHTVHKTTRSAE